MTTPIPEAAVEAAARALTPSQWAVYDNLVASGETTEYPASSIIAPSIETATRLLTAARPHMEVEALERTAKDYAYVFAVTAHKSPVHKWLMSRAKRAATIAERTQR